MTSAIQEWETANQETLGKLVGLLGWIIETVSGIKERRGTIRFEGGTCELIRIMGLEPEGRAKVLVPGLRNGQQRDFMRRRALPDDLYEKWAPTNKKERDNADERVDEKTNKAEDGDNGGGMKLG